MIMIMMMIIKNLNVSEHPLSYTDFSTAKCRGGLGQVPVEEQAWE